MKKKALITGIAGQDGSNLADNGFDALDWYVTKIWVKVLITAAF
jgi:hypothetical protein